MTLVSLSFEVHQPIRLKKNFFWDGYLNRQVVPDLWKYYFDESENRRIFERVSDKCYLPANRAILEGIKKYEGSDRPFKVAYSFSGIFLEECKRYRPDVLDSFVDLVQTGQVEVMEQTYYHSLSSLYDEPQEYIEQIKMHRELIWDIFALRPTTFENTELIYNDQIGQIADRMGYKAIFTEGVVADPNFVYRPPNTSISLLLRNYQLTDDIGFRFSSHNWEQYPLTADKYASWLANAPGKCINIFCDYETFGEHQWTDTGIFEFLRALPDQILRYQNLRFATPGEIASSIPAERELSVEKLRLLGGPGEGYQLLAGKCPPARLLHIPEEAGGPGKREPRPRSPGDLEDPGPIRPPLLHIHPWGRTGRGAQLLQPLRHRL